MCDEGEFPVVAAYTIETGEYQWSRCSPEQVWRSMVAATDEAVYLSWYTSTEQTAAFDADDGSDVAVAELPANPDPASSHAQSESGFVVDGVRIEGGQDVSTRAFDDASGELMWEQPGSWVYGDVSAVGDGAVFALERGARLVGYELDTGDVRWETPVVDPYSTSSWPWHVAGQRLFTLWFNAQVLSTIDGSLLWRTDYPTPTGPGDPTPLRMSGVRANDRTVFVAFSPASSGGD